MQALRHNRSCSVCSKGHGSLIKCLCCTSVWHAECVDHKDIEVCLFCLHEQVEAGEESKRWASYLQTRPRLLSKALRIKESMAGNRNVTVHKKCLKCKTSRVSVEVCRVTLGHTAPDWKVTRAAQATEARAEGHGEEKVHKKVLDKSEDGAVDQHGSLCHGCHQGGKLLCCDHCTRVWHMECVQPVMSKVPKGKWACPQCFEVKPQAKCTPPQPVRRAAKRKAGVSISGLLGMVPSDLSFKQQMELALRQSKREEVKRIRLSQGQRTLHATITVASKKSPFKSEAPLPKRRRYKRIQSSASDSEVTSETSQCHAARRLQPSPCALSDVYSSDTVLDEELLSQDFVVEARTEKVQLEGFSICAGGAAL